MKHVTNLVALNLTKVDGNAFSLMAAFKQAAKSQGAPAEEIKAVLEDCMSSDYNHLLAVLAFNTK